MNSQLFQPPCFLYLLLQMNSQLFQPPFSLVFVIADEFSVVPTSMYSCICYCRWILSCSNLHFLLYLLLQMNSQLFQPPCFLVFVIADEFSVVPTSMFSCICYCRWILSCSNLHVFLYLLLQMNSSCSNLHVFLYLLLQMNSQLFQPPCFLVFVIADEFSVVPTSMFSCICYCRWILSCSNLHVFNLQLFQPPCFLYLLLQMNSQLFQPPCFFVFVIADEFSVVPTSMFSCICYCRWILSCSNLHVFLYLLLQMNSQLFQPPCFLVFVIADEFSVVPTSMFSCICYCRWILSCSNLHVFLYLLLQMNSQLFQPPCFLVFVIADEFSVVPTSMFSCICYCRWILSCSNLHVFLYLLLQMNSQLFQPPCFLVFVIADEFSVVPTSMFSCICYCRWILSCSNLHVFLYLLLQMNSQLFQPPCFLVFVIADEFSVVPTSMFSCICYCRWILSCSNLHVFLYLFCRWILSCSNLHVFLYLLLQMNSQLFQPPWFLLYLLLQMNSQLFQPPCFLVFVIADEFSVVPTSMFSCICYCRWILSCSNLHVFLYLLLQMNSQLFQPPCFLVFVIADEFSVVPTSMFSCICYCRWILSCSNLQQMNSHLFQPPCFLVFVIADEFSVVPTSMFSCICYCRWILSCSNLHVFLYLLLQMNSQLFQPPCFLVFVIADEFSVVPTSMFSCICYCRWILSCSNLHVFLYLLLQMNSQLFQPPCFLVFVIADEFSVVPTSMFSCICYCRWILSCSNLHVFLYLLLQVNSQLFQPPCFLVFVIADEFLVVPTPMFSCICYWRWIISCSNLHVFFY